MRLSSARSSSRSKYCERCTRSALKEYYPSGGAALVLAAQYLGWRSWPRMPPVGMSPGRFLNRTVPGTNAASPAMGPSIAPVPTLWTGMLRPSPCSDSGSMGLNLNASCMHRSCSVTLGTRKYGLHTRGVANRNFCSHRGSWCLDTLRPPADCGRLFLDWRTLRFGRLATRYLSSFFGRLENGLVPLVAVLGLGFRRRLPRFGFASSSPVPKMSPDARSPKPFPSSPPSAVPPPSLSSPSYPMYHSFFSCVPSPSASSR